MTLYWIFFKCVEILICTFFVCTFTAYSISAHMPLIKSMVQHAAGARDNPCFPRISSRFFLTIIVNLLELTC